MISHKDAEETCTDPGCGSTSHSALTAGTAVQEEDSRVAFPHKSHKNPYMSLMTSLIEFQI